MDTEKHEMSATKIRYKGNLDERIKLPWNNVRIGSIVFIRKHYKPTI